MTSPRTLGRIAGLLYLIVGLFGGFSQGYFQPLLYRAGDPGATWTQVMNHAALVPWGVAADLTQVTAFLFLALVLQTLLRPFGEGRARAMVALVAVAVAIMALNNILEWGAYRVAMAQASADFGAGGQRGLVYLLLDLQHSGVLMAQVFFGLWLVPLGLLAWDSGLFPRWLGVLLVTGGICYLVNLVTLLLTPDLGAALQAWIVVPSGVAEVTMVVYLLVFGVRKGTWDPGRLPTTGPTGSADGSGPSTSGTPR